jgi:malate dehydrogenase (oxaloacetate-decarboxylating)(NADP+)
MLRDEALDYHASGRPGKVQIAITKSCVTQRDLALACTPGVAEPVREIEKNPLEPFRYTARGNLVAVVSNGTAVLGLGDVGPLAGKPVMEGKSLLFKRFADVDVFDIEIDAHDPDDVVRIVTALEVAGKSIHEVHMAVSGAGAAAIACCEFFVQLGMRREHVTLADTRGVIYKGRVDHMNPYKTMFAADTTARTLADAMEGADVFLGVSVAGVVSKAMVESMADRPIVFALANPDPEIGYDDARSARPDVIMATGRSDYPNQVNNVLGFPFIVRGALDVRARAINDSMKVAAARALAGLAREDVPDPVLRAYGLERLEFGPDCLIPKPLDPRVPLRVAPAVAPAAIASGVARHPIDEAAYAEDLANRLTPVTGHAFDLPHVVDDVDVVHHEVPSNRPRSYLSGVVTDRQVRTAPHLQGSELCRHSNRTHPDLLVEARRCREVGGVQDDVVCPHGRRASGMPVAPRG